ncbi:hypothetical protein [Clostridium rectalis]|uniref:hypothetical protein n=1 Tax=Clostridium rectalis TaxID=2040295 RepID=UPI0013DDB60A|nr:hypothetical protein [Clostridium rectalis]
MNRIEIIPYNNLDERWELCRELEKEYKNKRFKNYKDLGNCFIVKHYNTKHNIRM